VLASGSATRAMLLRNAGLRFSIMSGTIEEGLVRRTAHARGEDAGEVARALAESKATMASTAIPEALVIGADQILDCEGTWFEKPRSRGVAAEQLRALRGRTHRLATAVACAREGKVLWAHLSDARVGFREFSEELLQGVLDADSAAIGGSVGGYRLEGPAVLLCHAIEGDHFTILGLPLLPLLCFLRGFGVLVD